MYDLKTDLTIYCSKLSQYRLGICLYLKTEVILERFVRTKLKLSKILKIFFVLKMSTKELISQCNSLLKVIQGGTMTDSSLVFHFLHHQDLEDFQDLK